VTRRRIVARNDRSHRARDNAALANWRATRSRAGDRVPRSARVNYTDRGTSRPAAAPPPVGCILGNWLLAGIVTANAPPRAPSAITSFFPPSEARERDRSRMCLLSFPFSSPLPSACIGHVRSAADKNIAQTVRRQGSNIS